MPNYATQVDVSRYYRPGRSDEAEDPLSLKKDSGSGETNKDRVQLTAANLGKLAIDDKLRLYDDANPRGETAVIETQTFDGDDSYATVTGNLTNQYTTGNSAKAVHMSYFGPTTVPPVDEVRDMIDDMEAKFEAMTHHAWRAITVTEEFHHRDFRKASFWPGMQIGLHHRKVRAFVSGTDKIEIWNGSSWVDWVATRTEGRGNDFWLDYTNGILFVRGIYFWHTTSAIRVTYRYGEATVPADVRSCIAMMVARELLATDVATGNLPGESGGAYPSASERITDLRYRVEEIVKRYTEMVGDHR